MKLRLFALGLLGMLLCTDSRAALPAGWSKVNLDSEWLGPGNNPINVCNGLARTRYGDRGFELISTSESMRWRVPEFRIDAQYQYHCVILLAPEK